jgi:hypothetical protein
MPQVQITTSEWRATKPDELPPLWAACVEVACAVQQEWLEAATSMPELRWRGKWRSDEIDCPLKQREILAQAKLKRRQGRPSRDTRGLVGRA